MTAQAVDSASLSFGSLLVSCGVQKKTFACRHLQFTANFSCCLRGLCWCELSDTAVTSAKKKGKSPTVVVVVLLLNTVKCVERCAQSPDKHPQQLLHIFTPTPFSNMSIAHVCVHLARKPSFAHFFSIGLTSSCLEQQHSSCTRSIAFKSCPSHSPAESTVQLASSRVSNLPPATYVSPATSA